jgi:hypothetical protein
LCDDDCVCVVRGCLGHLRGRPFRYSSWGGLWCFLVEGTCVRSKLVGTLVYGMGGGGVCDQSVFSGFLGHLVGRHVGDSCREISRHFWDTWWVDRSGTHVGRSVGIFGTPDG